MIADPSTPTAAARGGPSPSPEREAALRAVAREFEASFLAEMLRQAGAADARQSFGGGPGEEAFSGLMADEHARLMTESGGIGLAETIFRALARREAGSGSDR